MAEKITATLKRKSKPSGRSVSSESDWFSRRQEDFHFNFSETDIGVGSLDDSSNQVLKTLNMSNKIRQQLEQIL